MRYTFFCFKESLLLMLIKYNWYMNGNNSVKQNNSNVLMIH